MTPPLDWGREEEREAPTGGACYQVRVTGPAPQARPLVDMPPSVRSLARAVWAAGAVLALAVIACVLVALLVTGCARPSAPVVELQEGGAPPPPPSLGDPCDCAYALAACAPSGYRCGVGVACADGIPYRRTDAGIALVSRACPVPLTDRGRVVALCLDGDACVVDAATGDVAPWRDGP